MAKKTAMPTLPKTIYVYQEDDGDESWLVANYTREDCAHDDQNERRLVGTYQLVEVGEIKTAAVYTKK